MSAYCKYIYSTGKYAGKQCDIRPAGGTPQQPAGDYCYKHKVIAAKKANRAKATAAISADPIFSSAAEPAKESETNAKKKFSVFNCTINSQKNYATMSAEDKLKFKRFVDWLFLPSGETALKFMTDAKAPDMRNILEAKAEHHFEVGDLGKLHAHGQILVTHTGHITFWANKVREAARKILGYTIHWDCQASSNHVAAYAEYMRKKNSADPVKF